VAAVAADVAHRHRRECLLLADAPRFVRFGYFFRRSAASIFLRRPGCESLWAIAAGLEERGIPVARLGAAGIPFGGSAVNGTSVGTV
jgi:hypothetical protein